MNLHLPTPSVMRDRNFRLLWTAGTIANSGELAETIVVGWLVLQLGGSAWEIALVALSRTAFMFAFSVFAGAIGDRIDRRILMAASHGANVTAVASILVLLITGDIQIWHLYALGAVHGITRAFDNTSRRAVMFQIVGAKGLMQAISMEHMGFSTGRIVAPIIAGLLLEVTDSAISNFAVLLGLYSISLYSVFNLRVKGLQDKKPSTPVLSSIVEGFRYAYTTPVIAAVLCVSMVMNVLFQYNVFIPVVAQDYLHVGETLMGLLAAADGIGKVSGSIVASVLVGKIKRHGRIYLLGSLGLSLSLLGFALSPWYALSFFLLVALGFSQIGFSTMQSGIILMSTPTKLHGRVMGVQQLAVGTGQLGSLELGAMVALIGVPATLAVNAAVAILLLGLIAVFMPALRRPLQRLPDEPQPPVPSTPSGRGPSEVLRQKADRVEGPAAPCPTDVN